MHKHLLKNIKTIKVKNYNHYSILTEYYQNIKGIDSKKPPKIAIIGSGNFGCAIARRVALNMESKYPDIPFDIKMWVYEEIVNGASLTETINNQRVNTKYLPNVILPKSIKAYSDIIEASYDADILLFVVAKKYLNDILINMKGHVRKSAIGVSLIKCLEFSPNGPILLTDRIKNDLGLDNIAVMMGANIASDLAYDKFVETTIASNDLLVAKQVALLFDSPIFRTELSTDVSTVEFCGALKNIVSIGAGFCDGMGLSASTRAALIRQGLQEIALFCKLFDIHASFQMDTLFKSCGIADLIASSNGGRNRLCSATFAKRIISQSNDQFFGSFDFDTTTSNNSDDTKLVTTSNRSISGSIFPSGQPVPKDPWQSIEDAASELWEDIELELLNGQALQGIGTCKQVIKCLEVSGYGRTSGQFPLFHRIHDIACMGEDINTLFDWDTHHIISKSSSDVYK